MAVSIATNTSYLELPTDVRYATLQQFTVCGWFMLNDVTAVSYRGMWSLGLAGANGRVWAAVDATTLKPAGNAFDGTLAKYTQTNMGGSVMTNKSGVWIYFAYWFDLTQSTVESNLVFPFLIDCYWPGDPVLTPDVGASGTVVLPAAGTFRVGQDHDGDSMRGGAQNVRMFDRLLTIQEIRDNMYASDCPYDLRQSCPIDLPLDVDGRNLGYVGGIATATGTVAFGSGATLPPAPLPLRFRGAVKPSGVIVTGAQATETDTANAGTPSITVAATRASETDTGAAGAAAVTIAAGRATETDTGASGTAAVAVASVRAIETDTGSAGTALIRPAGTQATETDTGTHGAIALNKAGAMATETDTGATGTPAIKPAGSLISETDTGAHGVPAVALPSNRATETDTGASGTAAITVVATRVTETDTGATGTPALRPSGTLVAETDSASAGASNVRPQGLQAQETDTASHGLSGAVVLGTLATETDTASSGTSAIQPHGSLMSETDTGSHGVPDVRILGSQPSETDTGIHGLLSLNKAGSEATETDTANGSTAVNIAGLIAFEADSAIGGSSVVAVVGTRATEADTAAGGGVLFALLGQTATESDLASAGFLVVRLRGSQALETDIANLGSSLQLGVALSGTVASRLQVASVDCSVTYPVCMVKVMMSTVELVAVLLPECRSSILLPSVDVDWIP